jgi:predicted amidohydrolase YtcJ
MSAFGPGGRASRELIDAIVPDRPVMLVSADGHTIWVNSKALEVAGITRDTPDPKDGRIDRDPKTGEPVGSLQEGAGSLVSSKAPETTPAQRQSGLRYAIKLLDGFGITGVQDAAVEEQDHSTRRVSSHCTWSVRSGGNATRASGRLTQSSASARRIRKAT